jgi:predicted ATPase
VLCVLGDAGIGKTRLLEELRAEAGAEVTWLSGRCSPHGIDGSYAPFADFVRSGLNLEHDAPGIAVRTRLHARADSALGPQAARLVEPLERLLAPDAAGPISAGALRSAFADLVDVLSAERPLVLVLDDLHWADSGTRALAEDLLAKTDETAVLIAAAFRVDRTSEAWKFRLRALSDFGHRLTELEVAPLDLADAAALAVETAAGSLDESSARLVAERAEGNPLFVEQLLAELVDSGRLQRRRTWTVTASADELPPALESLLLARLDRLSPSARSVLRVAAVVGRTSPRRVLEQVEGRPLDDELTELLRGGVLREARRYPEPELGFEHGLVQELELGTLPPARRRELYARVARAFEELYGEAVERHLERLAHYYSRSDEPEKALDYLERAGTQARELGMDDQAAELWRRGWRLATRIGNGDAERRLSAHLAALTP